MYENNFSLATARKDHLINGPFKNKFQSTTMVPSQSSQTLWFAGMLDKLCSSTPQNSLLGKKQEVGTTLHPV